MMAGFQAEENLTGRAPKKMCEKFWTLSCPVPGPRDRTEGVNFRSFWGSPELSFDKGLIHRDPTRKVIIKGKEPRGKKIKYLNQFQLHSLLKHLDLEEKVSWDWFILLVAKTGMRFSEAMALTPADFDFVHQTV